MNSESPKTLGIVITDGVGFRNFVLSTFLDEAARSFHKIVIFSGLPNTAFPELDAAKFTIVELPVFTETKKNWFWRKLKEVAHLQKHKTNPGIADNYEMNKAKSWSPHGLLVRAVYAVSSVFHSEKNILKYENFQEQSFADDAVVKQYGQLVQEHQPDLLFFTHQRPPFIATLVFWAKKLKIPTASFIFSWDNLASKGRMAASFDYFLVWSELMKNELLRFYPFTKPEAVSIVGTPQFEPYVLPQFDIPRAEFYATFGLNSEKKILCYSCADATIGPNDPLVIATLAEGIRNGAIEPCQLLVRTSPAEDESRFAETKAKYSEIKWNHPKWELTREGHPEPWSQRVPNLEDLSMLKAILKFCDLNVNMLSTMSLDFMLFEKPVVNTAFGNGNNGLYNDQRFLQYEHYDNVVKSGAVKIAKNEDELFNAVNAYLENPELDLENRKKLIAMQVGKPLEKTTRACVEALKAIL
ncbi:hypothetical protein ACFSYG_19990 [Leeuwenhoekiella polynyae]|uniref:Uncharacterized protein n=1 Tax=Leeuwenhoekiella polynyae TaxID=1550906 RepID=A0A4Q0PF22_9FLAO|nr:hypothetical protein [Leeuwenhoekiella polynyae]RXG25168.1 hypothetical protein DSM02_1138 [Leeuwenhoekiella polynyae]